MLRLTIVLCAAAYFASMNAEAYALEVEVLPEGFEDSDEVIEPKETTVAENEFTRQIDESIEKIDNYSLEVFEMLKKLGPQDVNAVFNKTSSFLSHLEDHWNFLRSFVDRIVSSREGGGVDGAECHKYVNHYQHLIKTSFLRKIRKAPSHVLDVASKEFAKLTFEAKKSLKQLKLHASTADKSESKSIDEIRASHVTKYVSEMTQFVVHYEQALNGTAVEETIQDSWDKIYHMTPQLIEKTYECVYGSA